MSILGIDISTFQGSPDFDTLKSNLQFLIIKATEGTGFIDSKFSHNQSEARRVGLPLGYYHFAHPEFNTATDEANYFCSVVKPQTGEVLCLDYEANWQGNPVLWSKIFLDRVQSIYGCKPLIYLNQSLATSHDWSSVVNANYGLWIAAYTFDPNNNNFKTGAWKSAAMQQYSDKLSVPGISGGVDADILFGDINTFKAYGYTGGNMANIYKGYDLSNIDSMKVAVDILVRVQAGEFVDKSKYDTDVKSAHDQGFKEGVASVPAGSPTQSIEQMLGLPSNLYVVSTNIARR